KTTNYQKLYQQIKKELQDEEDNLIELEANLKMECNNNHTISKRLNKVSKEIVQNVVRLEENRIELFEGLIDDYDKKEMNIEEQWIRLTTKLLREKMDNSTQMKESIITPQEQTRKQKRNTDIKRIILAMELKEPINDLWETLAQNIEHMNKLTQQLKTKEIFDFNFNIELPQFPNLRTLGEIGHIGELTRKIIIQHKHAQLSISRGQFILQLINFITRIGNKITDETIQQLTDNIGELEETIQQWKQQELIIEKLAEIINERIYRQVQTRTIDEEDIEDFLEQYKPTPRPSQEPYKPIKLPPPIVKPISTGITPANVTQMMNDLFNNMNITSNILNNAIENEGITRKLLLEIVNEVINKTEKALGKEDTPDIIEITDDTFDIITRNLDELVKATEDNQKEIMEEIKPMINGILYTLSKINGKPIEITPDNTVKNDIIKIETLVQKHQKNCLEKDKIINDITDKIFKENERLTNTQYPYQEILMKNREPEKGKIKEEWTKLENNIAKIEQRMIKTTETTAQFITTTYRKINTLLNKSIDNNELAELLQGPITIIKQKLIKYNSGIQTIQKNTTTVINEIYQLDKKEDIPSKINGNQEHSINELGQILLTDWKQHKKTFLDHLLFTYKLSREFTQTIEKYGIPTITEQHSRQEKPKLTDNTYTKWEQVKNHLQEQQKLINKHERTIQTLRTQGMNDIILDITIENYDGTELENTLDGQPIRKSKKNIAILQPSDTEDVYKDQHGNLYIAHIVNGFPVYDENKNPLYVDQENNVLDNDNQGNPIIQIPLLEIPINILPNPEPEQETPPTQDIPVQTETPEQEDKPKMGDNCFQQQNILYNYQKDVENYNIIRLKGINIPWFDGQTKHLERFITELNELTRVDPGLPRGNEPDQKGITDQGGKVPVGNARSGNAIRDGKVVLEPVLNWNTSTQQTSLAQQALGGKAYAAVVDINSTAAKGLIQALRDRYQTKAYLHTLQLVYTHGLYFDPKRHRIMQEYNNYYDIQHIKDAVNMWIYTNESQSAPNSYTPTIKQIQDYAAGLYDQEDGRQIIYGDRIRTPTTTYFQGKSYGKQIVGKWTHPKEETEEEHHKENINNDDSAKVEAGHPTDDSDQEKIAEPDIYQVIHEMYNLQYQNHNIDQNSNQDHEAIAHEEIKHQEITPIGDQVHLKEPLKNNSYLLTNTESEYFTEDEIEFEEKNESEKDEIYLHDQSKNTDDHDIIDYYFNDYQDTTRQLENIYLNESDDEYFY
ncbi:9338_t:CDS:10, partial [Ambispora gerdemannii]